MAKDSRSRPKDRPAPRGIKYEQMTPEKLKEMKRLTDEYLKTNEIKDMKVGFKLW